MILRIFHEIRALLAPQQPDPKRFANAIPYVANFHGELVGAKNKGNIGDKVQIQKDGTVTFFDQSAFSGIDIPPTLTPKDLAWLKKKNLDVTNPAYQKAKAYFSQHPACDKHDLASAAKIGTETAKDVIAGFKKNIEAPTPLFR